MAQFSAVHIGEHIQSVAAHAEIGYGPGGQSLLQQAAQAGRVALKSGAVDLKGMGLLFLSAMRTADYDMIMFLEVIYTFIGLFSNLVTDLCYGLVDPRVRISK